jgi:small subunit ribosomal protein S4e
MTKLKRLLAPKFWLLHKKERKWSISPIPGPHKKFECIPLLVIVRDVLKLAETGSEAEKILKMGDVLVDGKAVKNRRFPAGLMDVIGIPKIKKHFRITPIQDGLHLLEIDEKEAKIKICRINNKTTVRKGRMQLNMHDGKNILVDKNAYATGDSVVIEVPSKKILEHIKFENGSIGLIIKGKNAGKLVKIKNIGKDRVECEMEGKDTEVAKSYILVVGKDKPVIKLGE